jgi:diguanylate cyclase (GGDEF)-like protein
MICDIDHLKQISDVHGHLVGDEVLQQLSTRLQDLVRPYDGVGRYGGEEVSGCARPGSTG